MDQPQRAMDSGRAYSLDGGDADVGAAMRTDLLIACIALAGCRDKPKAPTESVLTVTTKGDNALAFPGDTTDCFGERSWCSMGHGWFPARQDSHGNYICFVADENKEWWKARR